MTTKHLISLRTCGLCALISTIIFFICISLSISLSPWFSWTDHFLSEIAGSFGQTSTTAARGFASIIFNSGLILAGLIGILFALLIRKTKLFQSKIGRVGTFVLFIDMTALCGVGIFPITYFHMHYFFTVLLFCLIPICLFILAHEIGKLYGKKWWLIVNLISIISLCAPCMFLFTPNLSGYDKAIGEMVMLCSLYLTFIILGIKLVNTKSIVNLKG